MDPKVGLNNLRLIVNKADKSKTKRRTNFASTTSLDELNILK